MMRFFLACCVCVPSLLGVRVAASAPAETVVETAVETVAESSSETPAVLEVISTTPIPGLGLARDVLPYPVRSIDAAALERARGITLPSLFNSQLPGVTVNEIQGNPYQANVNFRGFTASPLLGTPQGLSVFQDGVRLNEAFGDVVNWDLVPRAALAGVELIPGANPLFGLNTLGGALNLRTWPTPCSPAMVWCPIRCCSDAIAAFSRDLTRWPTNWACSVCRRCIGWPRAKSSRR